MSDVENLVLPSGESVLSHTVPVSQEALRQSLRKNMVSGATHVITIKGGVVIKKGDNVRVNNDVYTVLAAYDPFVAAGVRLPDALSMPDVEDETERAQMESDALRVRVQARDNLAIQKNKWIKILIRK